MEKKLVIFTDIGDTIIDEGTEIRNNPFGIVDDAACIPGAKETALRLYGEGYTIVMVADGLVKSFENTMRINGLEHIFTGKVISEAVGEHKPSEKMFTAAMRAASLTDDDKPRVIMIGNNIKRDIVGANRFGIRSILFRYSPRYGYEPSCAEETPTYAVDRPEEIYGICAELEKELENG